MRRLDVVRQELAEATDRRTGLWYEHVESAGAVLSSEVASLSERIDALWSEARMLAAEIRHGDRMDIIARARAAERVERDLTRRQRAAPAMAARR
jgi:ATP-dependent Clp protease ATP-binding subunit ClpA